MMDSVKMSSVEYFGIFQLSMFIVNSICNLAEWGDNFENIFIIIQVSLSLKVDLFFFISLLLSLHHENTSYLYPYTGVKHFE